MHMASTGTDPLRPQTKKARVQKGHKPERHLTKKGHKPKRHLAKKGHTQKCLIQEEHVYRMFTWSECRFWIFNDLQSATNILTKIIMYSITVFRNYC